MIFREEKKKEQDQPRAEVYHYMHGSLKYHTSLNENRRFLFLLKHAYVKLHPLPIIIPLS